MLRSMKEIQGYQIQAVDGEIGKVDEFFFDDHTWTVRYMVVDTGPWILGRKVLISPLALMVPDWTSKTMPVMLTRKQVKESPDIEFDQPVSLQQEIVLRKHYDWPTYWTQPTGMPNSMASSYYLAEGLQMKERAVALEGQGGDPHLRRTKEVTGYDIQARDGEIGHVADFIVDDEVWMIRYMVVDTRDWLSGRTVLVSPSWIERIDYEDSKVAIDLKKKTIKNSPEYDPETPVNRDYEQGLYDFYGRPKYWNQK
jgi:uncharacterized protein YrrD